MLETALLATGATIGVFVVYFWLVVFEARRGKRVLFPRVRATLDLLLVRSRTKLAAAVHLPQRTAIRAQESATNVRSLMAPRPPLYETRSGLVGRQRTHNARNQQNASTPNEHFAALHAHRSDTTLNARQAKARKKRHLEERF